jgi:hypothetical protein
MGTQIKTVAGRTFLMLGLAAAATAALLYLVSIQASEASASTREVSTPQSDSSDISVSWTTTTPVTTTVSNVGKVWTIATYNMTVTFYLNSVIGSAVFTFTPESNVEIGSLVASSHFFRLEGTYEQGGGIVSLDQDIKIRLEYTPADLGGAREDTLRLFFYDFVTDQWLVQDKEVRLDPGANTIECKTKQTGLFGLGGYQQQTMLPVVLRSYH